MNMLPSIPARLLVRPQPVKNESLRGYVSRVSSRNGWSPIVKPFLESLQTTTKAIPKIATLTGCSEAQLETHGSYVKNCVGGGSGVLFGTGLLSTRQVRLERRMVCPVCIGKNLPISDCCWELKEYDVCHIHKCFLVSHCSGCNRPLSWFSMPLENCSCGVRFANIPAQKAPQHRVLICRLAAKAMAATVAPPDNTEVISGALTPLNWFLILLNFTRSILLPEFSLEHLKSRSRLTTVVSEKLLRTILNDSEYCQHLRQVIFLHAAKNPLTLARTLRLDNWETGALDFFRPCLKEIVIHDHLTAIKLKRKTNRKPTTQLSSEFTRGPDERRPLSHRVQLQLATLTSVLSYAFSEGHE